MPTSLVIGIQELIKAGATIDCKILPVSIGKLDGPLHQTFTIKLNDNVWYRSVPLNTVLDDVIWYFDDVTAATPEPTELILEPVTC